eukprot:8138153-Heterocapsa_arctica.AAC.1
MITAWGAPPRGRRKPPLTPRCLSTGRPGKPSLTVGRRIANGGHRKLPPGKAIGNPKSTTLSGKEH